MSDPIISIAMIEGKARTAFVSGKGRDDHGFNWHSVGAIEVWQKEWDLCHAEQQQDRTWATGELAHALARMSPP